MLRVVLSLFISLFVVGCGGPRYNDYFPCHDDGTCKPKVVVLPILNCSGTQLPWDISEELAEGFYYQLMDSGEFYVFSPEEVGCAWTMEQTQLFLSNDLSNVDRICGADFIVAMELIEHSNECCNTCEPCPCISDRPTCEPNPYNRNLTMRMRVKVIDVRCECPEVILYEIFKSCYTVTTTCHDVDYENVCWGNRGYTLTPCGTLHQRMIRDLSSRLEKVIWSSR